MICPAIAINVAGKHSTCYQLGKDTMFNQGNPAFILAFAMSTIDTPRTQSVIDTLQQLVEISTRRLALAKQVALAKWDSHTSVEDPSREKQIIESAVKQGESVGLDGTFVSRFFRAQIEASKTVQYHLLSDWYRAGRAPAHRPINLAHLRRELDRLQTALIAALADSAPIRANAACYADVAGAIGKYTSSNNQDLWPIYAIALDRALAAACAL